MRWMCESLSPGITLRPSASTRRVPGPARAAMSASSRTAVMRPADTASAAACGRAGSPVKIRPFRRTRSADPAVPGGVAAVIGSREATAFSFRAGLARVPGGARAAGRSGARPAWCGSPAGGARAGKPAGLAADGLSGSPGRGEDTDLGHDGRDVVGGPFLADLAVGDPVDVDGVPPDRLAVGRHPEQASLDGGGDDEPDHDQVVLGGAVLPAPRPVRPLPVERPAPPPPVPPAAAGPPLIPGPSRSPP